jgi:hypothetical protein
MSRWVVIPDLQVPDHDQRAVDMVCTWIDEEWQEFTGMLIVGDECDQPEPSRWNKGTAGEYAGTLQKNIDRTHKVLAQFREVMGDAPIHLMRSNHTDRISHYIHKYAPALASLRALDYPTLVGLDALNITWHDEPYEFEKGWLLAHGDEGSLIRTSGGTALGLAKRWGKSVVCGHTHRLGLQHDHNSVNGKITRHLFGVESGHLMRLSAASYLKAGSGNWQQGVTVIDNGSPLLHPIIGNRIGGVEYR